jgi:hypothetical protein
MPLGDDDAKDREMCARDGIHYCEPGNPYVKGSGRRAYHPHAREVEDSQESGWPSGDTVRNHCPVCGTTWTEELPQ